MTVRLDPDLSDEEVAAALSDAGVEVVRELAFAPHLYQVRVLAGGDPMDVSVDCHDDSRFVYAEPSFVEHIPGRFTPTDPDYDEQWQWENDGSSGGTADADVDAEAAWDRTRGDGTRVAVIDNSIEVDHPDLVAAVDGAGYFETDSNGDATFVSGTAGFPAGNHGTFCAGMAVARADNGRGGVGAANRATLVPVATLPDTVGSQATLARAVAYAADPTTEGVGTAADGADVISCSLGPNDAPFTMQTVLRDAVDFAVTSGRGGLGTPVFWATDNANVPVSQDQVCSYENTIAVGRSDDDDTADGSAFGPELEFLAPGRDVYSTTLGGGYGTGTGTSYATPLSAGVGALVLAVAPDLSWEELRGVLRDTAERVGGVSYGADDHHDDYGFGRINAADAVCAALRSVTLSSSTLAFDGVVEGTATVRAAVFDVAACGEVTLRVSSGPTLTSGSGSVSLPLGSGVTVTPAGADTEEAFLWVAYDASGVTAPASASGEMTVEDVDTGREWPVTFTATVIEDQPTAVDLVLDRSGSMAFDSGVTSEGGLPLERMELLQFAAPILVDLLEPDDAVGVVRFNQDASAATGDVAPAGLAPVGAGRVAARTAIGNLTPGGATSIGDGVALANDRLAALDGYPADRRATVVFTDGHENRSRYIADVGGSVNERVFAVGLGTPEQLRPSALDALTSGTGGYLVLTDRLDADDYFLLAKYFAQVLADVTNAEVVLDPESRLRPGDTHRIPFRLVEGDGRCDVIVLAPGSNLFRVSLETPAGDVVDPSAASSNPGLSYVVGDNVTYYRMTLPVATPGGEAHRGTWHAVLEVDEKGYRRYLNRVEELDPEGFRVVETHGVRYSLAVHARSALSMDATLGRTGYEPGATLTLRATVREYDRLPVEDATVEATVTRPDGTSSTVTLGEVESGTFETELVAAASGTYRFDVRARGRSLRGTPFTRERLLTGAVWHGGDDPFPTGTDDPRAGLLLCDLARCLTREAFAEALERLEVDPEVVLNCVERYCRELESLGEVEGGVGDRPRRPRPRPRPTVDVEELLARPTVRNAIRDIAETMAGGEESS
jgi:hypothetical protein